jgi:L-seryl-tRNA(Ser) seleniumtransferase
MADPNPLRALPSVEEVADSISAHGLPRALAIELSREAVASARSDILAAGTADAFEIAGEMAGRLGLLAPRPVINASGVLLHTNLGRAPVSESTAEAAMRAAVSYTNLELDLGTGERGGRGAHLRRLLTTLTGAEDALVVNNNAGAVLLALAACAGGLSVPVARGELIEIGGSYRLPAVMEAGGARLVEIGTTNRTHLGDYTTALQIHDCGAVLRVHPSNYRVEGFTDEVELRALVGETHRFGLPLIHDVGSGLLDATTPWLPGPTPGWLGSEPGVRQSIDAGVDLVTFSGDKLLGGPQAGVIVGTEDAVERLRSHPLARALRVDGPTEAALSATLSAYADNDVSDILFWHLATLDDDGLRSRVQGLKAGLGGKIEDGVSLIGAGSVPGAGIPTPHLRLGQEGNLFARLLVTDYPILTRRIEGDLVIDLRAVAPEDDDVIADMVAGCR